MDAETRNKEERRDGGNLPQTRPGLQGSSSHKYVSESALSRVQSALDMGDPERARDRPARWFGVTKRVKCLVWEGLKRPRWTLRSAAAGYTVCAVLARPLVRTCANSRVFLRIREISRFVFYVDRFVLVWDSPGAAEDFRL